MSEVGGCRTDTRRPLDGGLGVTENRGLGVTENRGQGMIRRVLGKSPSVPWGMQAMGRLSLYMCL